MNRLTLNQNSSNPALVDSTLPIYHLTTRGGIQDALGLIHDDVFQSQAKLTRQRMSKVLNGKLGFKTARLTLMKDEFDNVVGLSLSSICHRKKTGYIHWRVISPDLQGMGLMSEIHAAEVNGFRSDGVGFVETLAESDNGLKSLLKLGFQVYLQGEKPHVRLVL